MVLYVTKPQTFLHLSNVSSGRGNEEQVQKQEGAEPFCQKCDFFSRLGTVFQRPLVFNTGALI